MSGLILPITYMGNTKLHNRMSDTQQTAYPCEGVNCQYCKEEAKDIADRKLESEGKKSGDPKPQETKRSFGASVNQAERQPRVNPKTGVSTELLDEKNK